MVSEQSATFGAVSSQILKLHTNHRGMNKFRSRDDANYKEVIRELIKILQKNARDALNSESCHPEERVSKFKFTD